MDSATNVMNEQTDITLIPKKVGELTKTEKKLVMIEALRKEGYNDHQISQFLEVGRSHICNLNKKIKQGTLNPLVNKARRSLKKLIDGQMVGAMREVRGSDVLTACKLVLDRTDPVTLKTESTHVTINYDLSPEDRDRYAKALGLPAMDAVFEAVEQQEVLQLEASNTEADRDSSRVPITNLPSVQSGLIESGTV